MKQWRILMGMPVTIEIVDGDVGPGSAYDAATLLDGERHVERVFSYFEHVEGVFSPFIPTSETSCINNGLLRLDECSHEMKTILRLAEKTRVETDGYFDVYKNGVFNPVGIVKGWAVYQASDMLRAAGISDFYVDAGGDVQLSGLNQEGEYWAVGIRNPFDQRQIVKSLRLSDMGIATSGIYVRGRHIYDPHSTDGRLPDEIVSFTVLGPNVYEADRFATAAFAMGSQGIDFIEREWGLEGYMIDRNGMATMTSGFHEYVAKSETEASLVSSGF
jgi:FAD:protein FMN transferase